MSSSSKNGSDERSSSSTSHSLEGAWAATHSATLGPMRPGRVLETTIRSCFTVQLTIAGSQAFPKRAYAVCSLARVGVPPRRRGDWRSARSGVVVSDPALQRLDALGQGLGELDLEVVGEVLLQARDLSALPRWGRGGGPGEGLA